MLGQGPTRRSRSNSVERALSQFVRPCRRGITARTLLFVAILFFDRSVQASPPPGTIAASGGQSGSAELPVRPKDLEQALVAANRFLELLDADRFDDAWGALSEDGQQRITLVDWTATFVAARKHIGRRLDSRFLTAVRTDSVAGGSTGRYVVIALESHFSKVRLKETISLTLYNGRWTVMGYVAK